MIMDKLIIRCPHENNNICFEDIKLHDVRFCRLCGLPFKLYQQYAFECLTFNSSGSIPCSDSLGNTAACKVVIAPGDIQYFKSGLDFDVAYAANTVSSYMVHY